MSRVEILHAGRPGASILRETRPRSRARDAIALLFLTAGACAGGADGSSGRENAFSILLFSDAAGTLSVAEREEIADWFRPIASPDGTRLLDATCAQPMSSTVELRDLNGDGNLEVLIDWGNTCTSGSAGTSVTVFVKAADGHYRANLGFPGMIAEVRPTVSGFADLLVGGPGFCFGLWRWNGIEYAHVRNESQTPGGCQGR